MDELEIENENDFISGRVQVQFLIHPHYQPPAVHLLSLHEN